MVKGLGVSPEYVIYGMSYANIVLYGAAMPRYISEEEKDKQTYNADNPENNEKIYELFSRLNG